MPNPADEAQARFNAALRRWRHPQTGLFDFAKDRLKILDKNGDLVPLVFNESQLLLHEAVEDQRARKGLVRMVGLKGRRQGFSTYVAARYYWRMMTEFGRRVYILSHQKASTKVLFTMVERFTKYDPFMGVTPTGENNAQMLTFPDIEGSYTVATAGNAEGGRGGETNLFHGSEFGFWENADRHFASSVNTVSLIKGTEVILESTSGGPTGKFFEMFQKGQNQDSLYESVFIPWFKEKGNVWTVPANFALETTPVDDMTPSEIEIARVFDLTDGQMMFRRVKIEDLGLAQFKREFPATPDDAWSSLDIDTFINPAAVLRACARDTTPSGPVIMGVDPAGGGGDRFAVVTRQGNAVPFLKWRNKIDTLEATEWLVELIDTHDPDRVNVDAGNIGQAIITNLRARGPKYANVVRSVSFGSPSSIKLADKTRVGPENRRAEMWGRLKDWIEDREGCASIPNIDDLRSDLAAPKQIFRIDGDWLLMSKSDMKSKGLRSPDLGDALALTFASKEYFAERAATTKPSGGSVGVYVPSAVDEYGPVGDGGWMI